MIEKVFPVQNLFKAGSLNPDKKEKNEENSDSDSN